MQFKKSSDWKDPQQQKKKEKKNESCKNDKLTRFHFRLEITNVNANANAGTTLLCITLCILVFRQIGKRSMRMQALVHTISGTTKPLLDSNHPHHSRQVART